jgi:HSP20 family molecular chaperone IbpA
MDCGPAAETVERNEEKEREMTTAMLPELASVHLCETEDELVVRVDMPPKVDLSRVTARLVGGVLEITVPRVARRHDLHIPGFHPEVPGV